MRGVLFWREHAKITAMPDFMSRVLGPLSPTTGATKLRGYRFALLLLAATTVAHRGPHLRSSASSASSACTSFRAGRVDPLGSVAGPVRRARLERALIHLRVHASELRLSAPGLGPVGPARRLHAWSRSSRAGSPNSVKEHAETAERAINETRRRAETDQLREALIGSVSHELRTPLSSILGATTVLAARPPCARRAPTRGARRRGAHRDRAAQQRHPEPARRDAHQQRRPAAALRMGRGRRHRQCGARAAPRAARRRAAWRSISRANCRSSMSTRSWSSRRSNRCSTMPPSIRRRQRRSGSRRAPRTAQCALNVIDRGAGILPDELPRLGERFFRGEPDRRHDHRFGFRRLDRQGLPARQWRQPDRRRAMAPARVPRLTSAFRFPRSRPEPREHGS